jgi:ribose 5-phosphate isomerase A
VLEQRYGVKAQLRGVPSNPKQAFVTDNGAWIIDVTGLNIENPKALEMEFNQIPGVICNGIFALNPANTLIISSDNAIKTLNY